MKGGILIKTGGCAKTFQEKQAVKTINRDPRVRRFASENDKLTPSTS